MSSHPILSSQEVASQLQQPTPPALVDVRLAEDFALAHLPNAKNAAVLQVAFFEQLSEAGITPQTSLIVYGFAQESYEARHAVDKLQRAGFTQVSEFRGGLAAWQSSGQATEGSGEAPLSPSPLEGSFPVNLEESRVRWQGRNLLNNHYGHVPISSGSLQFNQGHLQSGEFTLNLTQLSCDDLSEEQGAGMLIGHLQNEDFFDVGNHPQATLKIVSTKPIEGSSAGAPNLNIDALLTLRGQTHPLQFQAVTGLDPEGRPAAQASFSFDRTLWGALYGSGKFFQRAAMHLVNDLVEIQVRILCD